VNPKRPKAELDRQPTLFALEETFEPKSPRPFSLPGILLGTSSFTAAGWEGAFYPQGMRSRAFLSYYARQFQIVEIDSTFYGTPSASTVTSWNEKTPRDFIFAVKVPRLITREKVLVACEAVFDEFIERMSLLGDKLGPLLQFPKFDKWTLESPDEAISQIGDGIAVFYVERAGGRRFEVTVAMDFHAHKYLKTVTDGEQPDELRYIYRTARTSRTK
jgi:Protein of unknown function DUF72